MSVNIVGRSVWREAERDKREAIPCLGVRGLTLQPASLKLRAPKTIHAD